MTRLVALLVFVLALLPLGAQAQPLPALFDVAGVAADDVLNIRLEPSASSEKVGVLGPAERDVEIIRRDASGAWGLVNLEDIHGWVSMRYLARQPGQDWGVFPDTLSCSGTEPFWTVSLAPDGTMRIDTPDGASEFGSATRFVGASDPTRMAVRGNGPDWQVVGIIAQAMCNDGMSNREYGLTFDMLMQRGPGPESLYSGCCSLRR